MKYFKIIAFVWLIFFAGGSFASETTEDCSEIKGGVYVQKKCTTITTIEETILGQYPIKNVPEEMISNINPKHLEESKKTGKPVVFNTELYITKIFPPTETKTTYLIKFINNEFIGDTEEKTLTFAISPLLSFIMLIMVVAVAISGFLGKSVFLVTKRLASIAIIGGMVIGLLGDRFAITGLFETAFAILTLGVILVSVAIFIAGIIFSRSGKFNKITGLLEVAFAGMIIIAFAGTATVFIAVGERNLITQTTLEWLAFCLGMILLEYLIVFGRIKYQAYQQKKQEMEV